MTRAEKYFSKVYKHNKVNQVIQEKWRFFNPSFITIPDRKNAQKAEFKCMVELEK